MKENDFSLSTCIFDKYFYPTGVTTMEYTRKNDDI